MTQGIEAPALQDVPGFEQAGELVSTVQKLSLARSVQSVQEIVRSAARRMTGADGASFVLRDHDHCYYADEDAIGPLWKGMRFPMTACVSGWSMINRQAVAIEDVEHDGRIPIEVYRPTFVRSLAIVPIRREDPIGAIGTYWAVHHLATPRELALLQALADCTSLAIANVYAYEELERARVDPGQLIASGIGLAPHEIIQSGLRSPQHAISPLGLDGSTWLKESQLTEPEHEDMTIQATVGARLPADDAEVFQPPAEAHHVPELVAIFAMLDPGLPPV